MDSTSLAQLDHVSKIFGTLRAVHNLSLSVERGQIYGLLGPNGAGKSTALFLLAGLLSPTEGKALVAGHLAHTLEAKRCMGFLGPTTGLFARLSPREILAYFGRLQGLSGSTFAARMEDVVGRLGLGEILDRRAEVLSTGERQRVSIARALLHDPALLILDEPTSGLDVYATRFLRDLIREERERGKAVVFSTHYLTEADLLCDRVGLLHKGTLLAEGAPKELRESLGAASLEEAFLKMVATREVEQPA